jgi:hypothetical protein
MELQAARQIIATLAQGIHPVTGELMPEDSPYNAPPVIRALFAVSQVLEEKPATTAKPERPARQLPANTGKPWSPADDERLQQRYAEGAELNDLALELGRTPFGIESRLVKFGKLPPRAGMRTSAPAAV